MTECQCVCGGISTKRLTMWKQIPILFLGILLLGCTIVKSQNGKDVPPNYRLPNTVKPTAYTINITPKIPITANQTNSTFEGSVSIEATTTAKVTEITLHAKNIQIKTKSIEIVNSPTFENLIKDQRVVEEKDFLIFLLASEIPENTKIIIKIGYSGEMASDMYGFYLSSYEENGTTEYIGSTQFESTSARRAFPCFDEPAYKATFKITINKVPKDFHAISNMPRLSLVTIDGESDFEFETTPPMSSYLVAFVVSKFKSPETNEKADTKVWVRPSALSQAKYAQQIGRKTLMKIAEFTGIDYFKTASANLLPGEMKKIDMIAIPDFAAGAMENWGLLTYRETALLYDENSSTKKDRQRVACVIAHEQGHQWFGDLVTLKWWDNTWLNEGFATYFEYHTLVGMGKDLGDCVSQDDCWEMKKQFVIEEHQTALLADSIPSSTPLTNPKTSSPTEISSNFGTMSYNKGGSVIRMMEHFLGTENFKKSLTSYLDINRKTNAEPKNLFDAMQPNAGKTLPKDMTMEGVMKNWIEKAGYPLVTISSNGTHYLMKQERFFLTNANESTVWNVPITYATKKEDFTNVKSIWLTEKEGAISKDEKDQWLAVNVNSRGYFRVKYEGDLLTSLLNILNNKTTLDDIPDVTRAQLIDDMLNLARADIVKYQDALNFIDFLKNDDSYFAWSSAFTGLRFLMQRYAENNSLGESLRAEILKMMSGTLYKYNEKILEPAKGENVIQTYNRVQSLSWACNLGDKNCIDLSKASFDKFMANATNKIPVDVRSIVYCNALRYESDQKTENGMTKYFKFLWDLFKKSNVAAEKINIINSIGCTKNEENLNTFLKFSLNENEVRKQDANYVFTSVYTGNDVNIKKALKFLTDNWESISTHYGGMNALSKVVNGLANRLTEKEDMDNLKSFIGKQEVAKLVEDVKEEVEITMKANLDWAQTNNDEIKDFVCKRDAGYAVCKKKGGGANSISASILLLILSIFAIYYRN